MSYKLKIALLLFYIFCDFFFKDSAFQANENLTVALQKIDNDFTKYLMIFFSLLGSTGFIGTFSFIYFALETNKIKGLVFSIYMIIFIFTNGLLKNAYHDPRPFWYFDSIKAVSCQTEFGNPSGIFYFILIQIQGHSFGSVVFYYYFYSQFFLKQIYKKKESQIVDQEDYFLSNDQIHQQNIQKQKYIWIYHSILFFYLLTIGLSQIYLGMHSFDQIFLGWAQGSIYIILFFNRYKKLLQRFLKSEANISKDLQQKKRKTLYLVFCYLMLNLLSFVVYIYLRYSYKLDDQYLQRIKQACNVSLIDYNAYDLCFIQSGVISFIYGLVLSIIHFEGQYKKELYQMNLMSMTGTQRGIRVSIFVIIAIIVFTPFAFIQYQDPVYQFIGQISFPMFIFGIIQMHELQKIYQYFNVQIKGDYMIKESEQDYSNINLQS